MPSSPTPLTRRTVQFYHLTAVSKRLTVKIELTFFSARLGSLHLQHVVMCLLSSVDVLQFLQKLCELTVSYCEKCVAFD